MPSRERYTKADYEIMRKFGERVGRAIESQAMSPPRVARIVGVVPSTFANYLRGERFPPPRVLRQLPAILHYPLSWFFDLPDERRLTEKQQRIVSLMNDIEAKSQGVADEAADALIRGLEMRLTSLRAEHEVQPQARPGG